AGMCLQKSTERWTVDYSCYEWTTKMVISLVPISWVVICWNYRAMQQMKRPRAKLQGQASFLQTEVIIFLVRLVMWYFLTPPRAGDVKPEVFQVLNIAAFLFTVMVCVSGGVLNNQV